MEILKKCKCQDSNLGPSTIKLSEFPLGCKPFDVILSENFYIMSNAEIIKKCRCQDSNLGPSAFIPSEFPLG